MEKYLQKYGPILDLIPDVGKYIKYSENAFVLGENVGGSSKEDWDNVIGKMLSVLMYHALNTSYSVRLLTTHAQSLEAFALLRVRLEQLIVCSYLIHTEVEKGFLPFLQDCQRGDHRAVESLKVDPKLFGIIEKIFPEKIDDAKKKAYLNETMIDPEYDFQNDRIKKKWTNLKTYDMCINRDKNVDTDDPISSIKLQHFYLTLYKPACSMVHSETTILTNNFITFLNGNIGPQLGYTFANLVNLAYIDIIQSYEVIKFVKSNDKMTPFLDLFKDFQKDILTDYDFLVDKIKSAL